MNRAEEFISKKEQELEQLRKDWHPELWALVMEAYAKSQEGQVSIEEYKLRGIEDTFRLVSNMTEAHKKDTCLNRMITKCWGWTKELLPEPPKTKDNEGA